jgi:catechol 2,3-dioxygenase-like lactoylglutathione lyase family enzyme
LSFIGIDHVQVAIPLESEARAREFYSGVLGLEEIPKPAPLLATGGVWFRVGPAELHLGVEADFQPARKAHPGLRVTDVQAVAAECTAAGFRIQWDERYPGVRRFYVADPFGNRLEIMQPA